MGAAERRDLLVLHERRAPQRAEHRDAELELVVVGPVAVIAGEDEAQVGAPGVDELADHQGPEAGRRAPVDVAAVVAG